MKRKKADRPGVARSPKRAGTVRGLQHRAWALHERRSDVHYPGKALGLKLQGSMISVNLAGVSFEWLHTLAAPAPGFRANTPRRCRQQLEPSCATAPDTSCSMPKPSALSRQV